MSLSSVAPLTVNLNQYVVDVSRKFRLGFQKGEGAMVRVARRLLQVARADRRIFFLGAVILVCLAVTACARGSYYGIPINSDTTTTEIRSLAHQARRGDKSAQLELGKRFEAGLGVEQDLLKARDLYFDAATGQGAGRISVSPPPNGKGAAPIIIRQSQRTATGLPEAMLRWERVQRRLAIQSEPPTRPIVVDAYGGIDDGESGLKELENFYRDGLFFWGLRPSIGYPLEKAMMEGAGSTLLSPGVARQSAEYAILAAGERGDFVSICRKRASARAVDGPVVMRVAAVCAASLCAEGEVVDGSGIASAVPSATTGSAYDRRAADAFGSATFAMRILSYCRAKAEAEIVEQRVWHHLAQYQKALKACATGCSSITNDAVEFGRSSIANILLWAIEGGHVDDPRVQAAIEIWNRDTPTDPFAGPARDVELQKLCLSVGVDYPSCRATYPYGYFLENRLFDLLGLLTRTSDATSKNSQISRFVDRYAIEIDARGARATVMDMLTDRQKAKE